MVPEDGETGTSGSCYSSKYSTFAGGGATQTSGGTGGEGSGKDYSGKEGTFGIGGNTGYKHNNDSYYSSGAGGRRLVRWRLSW